ncbi:MAG TPA: outer membrane efflux protein [Alphaproteobacteria bacterium]|nr:outer membrane efflux protein [Alphaproteobacteria bacterium]
MRFPLKLAATLMGGAALAVVASAPGWAASLSELLPQLIKEHNRVKAADAAVGAAKERVRAAFGGWYPTLNVVSHYGYEKFTKPLAKNTSLMTRELDFTVTQRVFDFGATASVVKTARLNLDMARSKSALARQSLILEAVTAYMNVFRTREALTLAKQSEDNIKKQTELENALVERGAGLATDVLQAKVQLAGAAARRVRAEGGLLAALNRYREVFGKEPGVLDDMVKPSLPVNRIPETIDKAVTLALQNNLQLRSAQITTRIAREAVRSASTVGFLPSVNAIFDVKYKQDVAGLPNFQREITGTVQLNWPFNLGLTALNTLKASKGDLTATEKQFADARDQIEEITRNAWDNLNTLKENAELLHNQANIAGEFLEFARKERILGRRSLLDVLSGETALINANSDAASADIDVSIAVFTLLDAMDELDLASFEPEKRGGGISKPTGAAGKG